MSEWTRRAFVKAAGVAASGALIARRATAAEPLDLVRDGRSDYVIVTPATPSPSQQYAAEELQAFVKQITGATLPLQTDAGPLPAKAILLGATRHTRAALGADADLAALDDDGFRLVTAGPHLLILGSPVRGTLYGVYELLETHAGCRWYASFHSVVPKRPTWTLPALDVVSRPAFPMREPFWWVMFPGDFAARCKANGNRMELESKHGGKIRFGGGLFVHTFNRLLPPEEFFATHPEYFSEINGQRTANRSQLCLTNPDVLRIVTERLLEAMRKDPDGKLFSVSQNDWAGYCTCSNCKAIDDREGSPSGTLIGFVNQVAAAVEQEFPNAWIETLAYQYTRHPPKTIKPRPNVVPRLCTIECDFSQPLDRSSFDQNRKFVEDIRGWSRITDKLYIWDYVTNFGHYLAPHPNFAALQGNVRFFRDHGVVGLFEQGAYQAPHAEFAELRAWVLAKLLWNPEADLQALYDDFFSGYYGAAAGPIREYWEALQALVTSPDITLRIWSPPTDAYYTDTFFDRAAALFADAERRVAGDPEALYRVQMTGLSVLYAKLVRMGTPRFTRVLRDGVLRPEGVDPAYAALAAETLRRIELGKVKVAESAERHTAFVNQLRDATVGEALQAVQAGPLTAGVGLGQGGSVLSLTVGGTEYLSAAAGGIGYNPTNSGLSAPEIAPYAAGGKEAGKLVVTRSIPHRGSLRREVTLAGDSLKLYGVERNDEAGPRLSPAALRCALDLGDAGQLCYRVGDGPWQALAVAAGQPTATTSLARPDGPVTIASAKTGRGARLTWPATPLERVVIQADASQSAAVVWAYLAKRELPGNGVREEWLTVQPLPQVSGLPNVAAATPGRQTVVFEDCFLSVGRPGEWGAHEADPDAQDGFGLRLFNTHYEWCSQWRVDPSRFEPGAQYTVRARIKVVPGATDGEAFWAGIYDVARKKGWGQIQPRVSETKPGYQWYEIGTWLPEAEQYVWFGPGRFDKEQAQRGVAEAVWIDRIEFVKAG